MTLLPKPDNGTAARTLPTRPETSRRTGRADTRDRILAAAAAVAHEVGPAHLSLDAVAAEAGVSKGGLLYHFPTKQALLVAIIETQLATVEQAIEAATRPPGQPNGAARALIEAFRAMMKCKGDPPTGVFAALAENPALIEPVRAHNCRTAERLKNSADPERALIAFYAIEGMRALHLFQADPLDQAERDRVLDAITGLLDPD